MQSIDLIRDNLKNSTERVLARVEDMRDHCLVFPTSNGGCHTLWVLGHLAYVEALVVRTFMQGLSNPLADWEDVFDGSDVSADGAHFPPFDRVLQACRAERAATLSLLDGLTEEALDRRSARVPESVAGLFGTYRRCLQYAANHWLMHRGHLADARRAAGLARAWF